MKVQFRKSLLSVAVLSLTACGGGSGDKPPPITAASSSSVASTSPSSASSDNSVATSSASSAIESSAVSSIEFSSSSVLGSSSSLNNSSSVSSRQGVVVTITGLVTDTVIPNAQLFFYVGDQIHTAQADANGKYTIAITANEVDATKPIKVVATGGQGQEYVEFVSLLPSFNTLNQQAGSDSLLISDENLAVNLTNVSTAEFALISQANMSITTDAELELARNSINENDKFTLAALIKIVVDREEYSLPTDVNTTLALVIDKPTSGSFLAAINAQDPTLVQNTINEIRRDSSLVEKNPLVGSWGNGSVVFLDNGRFLQMQQTFDVDDVGETGCNHAGSELGSYFWDPLPDMSWGGNTRQTFIDFFDITQDSNGNCGFSTTVNPIEKIIVTGDTLTLINPVEGNIVLPKDSAGEGIQGTWVARDGSGLAVLNVLSSTEFQWFQNEDDASGGEPGFEQGTYSYSSATGEFTIIGKTIDTNGAWGFPVGSTEIFRRMGNELILGNDELVFTLTPSVRPVANTLAGTSWDGGAIVFLNDHQYIQTQKSDPDCEKGIELGTYEWNSVTGLFTPNALFDGNDNCGFSTPLPEDFSPFNITANGDQLSLVGSDGNEDSFTYPKTPSNYNTIIGTWIATSISGKLLLTSFTETGFLLSNYGGAADAGGQPGLEYGTYTYNSTSGVLEVSLTLNTDGDWGFSDAPNKVIQIMGDSYMLTCTNCAPEGVVFKRFNKSIPVAFPD